MAHKEKKQKNEDVKVEKLDRKFFDSELVLLQQELAKLQDWIKYKELKVVVIFEGRDAAGKGGAIKRLTENIDPRGYVVWPIAAPAGEERERHYLYRFWRRLPEQGQIAIFDRSWYGRVLVERLEGFCSEEAWKRAYGEINHFEREMTDFGTVILKFWLHISKDEQLARFRERERTNYKSWKITDEDWRNRGKWEDYMLATQEMLLKTSTTSAPWTLVEANDKLYSRIKILRTVAEKLRHALK